MLELYKKYKNYIIVFLLLCSIIALFFLTGSNKELYEIIVKDEKAKQVELKKEIEALKDKNRLDSIAYSESYNKALELMKTMLDGIDKLKQERKNYEKAINDFGGDFNERFVLFTNELEHVTD